MKGVSDASTAYLTPLLIYIHPCTWAVVNRQLRCSFPTASYPMRRKKKPHPQPLSEWRGEWKLLFADEEGVSLRQGKALLYARKRPLQMEERLMSFLWRRGVGEMLALLAKERTPTSGSLDPYLLIKWIIVWYLQILQFMRNFALS